jgi:hypothetical protein
VQEVYARAEEAGFSGFLPEKEQRRMDVEGMSVRGPNLRPDDPEVALRVKEQLMNRFLMEKQAGGPKTISGKTAEGKPSESQYQAGIGVIPGSEQEQFQAVQARKHGDVITQPGGEGEMPATLGEIATTEGTAKAKADLAKKNRDSTKALTVSQAKSVMELIEKQNNLANMMVDPDTGEYDPMFPQHPMTEQLPTLQAIIEKDVKGGAKERGLDTKEPAPKKTVKRTGKVKSGPNAGKTVVEYTDGTKEYK